MGLEIISTSDLSALAGYLKEQYEVGEKCGLCHILSSGSEMARINLNCDLFLSVGQGLLSWLKKIQPHRKYHGRLWRGRRRYD